MYMLAFGIALAVCARRRPRDTPWLLILCAAVALAGYRAAADAAGTVANPPSFVGGVFAGGLVALLAVGVALGRQSSKIVAVGTRVIGSWVAALCAMMFALCLRT
jgi:hydrogenase/urease accessory protein HupE